MTGLEKDLQAYYQELGRVVARIIRLEQREAKLIEIIERLEKDSRK